MEHSSESFNIFAPDVVMLILTWATFIILLVILKKFAWGPILDALDKREAFIRQSLVDADKARQELSQADAEKQKILQAAKAQASQIVEDARKGALSVAADLEAKAREGAHNILQSATAEISLESQRVSDALKKESIETAIKLASKVLKENLDNEKNRRLIEEAVKGI